MIKELNLHRVWEIMNKISYEEFKLGEHDVFVSLLGYNSSYYSMEFEAFLNYYSFKIDGDTIVVYNSDPIPYEEFNIDDFSYVPTVLLSFSPEKIEKWIEEEIEKQLKQQENEKLEEKERLKREIERLQKQLERYE